MCLRTMGGATILSCRSQILGLNIKPQGRTSMACLSLVALCVSYDLVTGTVSYDPLFKTPPPLAFAGIVAFVKNFT